MKAVLPMWRSDESCVDEVPCSPTNSDFPPLKDAIYSSVASFISNNECRPHFLLLLFRQLNTVNTDAGRRRLLASLNTATVASFNSSTKSCGIQTLLRGGDRLLNEMENNLQHVTSLPPSTTSSSSDSPNRQRRSSYLPFANESLGDTVIHVNKTMQMLRAMHQTSELLTSSGDAPPPQAFSSQFTQRNSLTLHNSEPPSQDDHSPMLNDLKRPASVNGLNDSKRAASWPRHAHLQDQVKRIINFLVPHMFEFSDHKLMDHDDSLRRVVIGRVIVVLQNFSPVEIPAFTNFFIRQLNGQLQNLFQRYQGKLVSECTEDVLVDITELLYNELAFYNVVNEMGRSEISTSYLDDNRANAVLASCDDVSSCHAGESGKYEETNAANEDEERHSIKESIVPMNSPSTTCYTLSLAPSETKPWILIGSDEDEADAITDEEIDNENQCPSMMSENKHADETVLKVEEENCQINLNASGNSLNSVDFATPMDQKETEIAKDKEKEEEDDGSALTKVNHDVES